MASKIALPFSAVAARASPRTPVTGARSLKDQKREDTCCPASKFPGETELAIWSIRTCAGSRCRLTVSPNAR